MGNSFFEHEYLSNDKRQARFTLVGLGLASIVSVALIIATVLM